MVGFLEITTIRIPRDKIAEAYKLMRFAGSKSVEGMALFAGKQKGNTFEILETIIPRQNSYRLESGLMYAVDADELHRINVWLFNNGFRIIAQIHSHPNEAYHSETDNQYPIVATIGGISIVVPRFASDPIDIDNWAVYRLSPQNLWEKQSAIETRTIFEII